MDKINLNVKRGTRFRVKKEGCRIMITTFEGRGAAGCIEHAHSHKLHVGDIIIWDHQSYLGSDPGPGVPWFSIENVERGGFWPNDWGQIDCDTLEKVE